MADEMACEDVVRGSTVIIGMTDSNAREVASRLIDELVNAGQLPAGLREAAKDAVHAREVAGGCTALAHGIAIPHGYLDELTGPVMALGIHSSGVDCSAIDGQPTRIFILILNHRDSRSHIRVLTEVNRRLLRPEIRGRLLLAKSRADVMTLLCPSV